MNPWEELYIAIVREAAEAYREALKTRNAMWRMAMMGGLTSSQSKRLNYALMEIGRSERFFVRDCFGHIDGTYIMNEIRKEVGESCK